ncbi:MipA/OmpV family protein [Erwinia sp. 198]|uniref:MipA/OmpV family protein n=1 Tax=Erwinia sp. 198 TaxID=2022746 RepID=UPI000F65C9FD|nr:MipA/OmpV family protein [Erwinia sp. 198]RRZ90896.1 MipA/OmpV family protein [Erwinia sp. 198]
MTYKIVSGVSLALLLGTSLHSAQADDFSLGLTAGWSSKLYKDVNPNKNSLIFPNVDYDAGRFWFHGLSAGFDILHTPADNISLVGYYFPLSFKASDSHSHAMRQLKNRRSTLMTGIRYEHESLSMGKFETTLATDALGTSNGFHWNNAWSYPVQMGSLGIEPALGFNWNDRKFNKYYYGISADEVGRSGLRKYTPGESVTPYAEINLNYTLTEKWNIYGGARYTLLPDDVKKSPMIEKDSLLSLWTGVAYTF